MECFPRHRVVTLLRTGRGPCLVRAAKPWQWKAAVPEGVSTQQHGRMQPARCTGARPAADASLRALPPQQPTPAIPDYTAGLTLAGRAACTSSGAGFHGDPLTALLRSSTLSSPWAPNVPRSRPPQGLFTGLLFLLSTRLFPGSPRLAPLLCRALDWLLSYQWGLPSSPRFALLPRVLRTVFFPTL